LWRNVFHFYFFTFQNYSGLQPILCQDYLLARCGMSWAIYSCPSRPFWLGVRAGVRLRRHVLGAWTVPCVAVVPDMATVKIDSIKACSDESLPLAGHRVKINRCSTSRLRQRYDLDADTSVSLSFSLHTRVRTFRSFLSMSPRPIAPTGPMPGPPSLEMIGSLRSDPYLGPRWR
jgi:hypothetical protein